MLGQGCRNASPGTRQSRVDGILPRRGGGSRAEVYLPPKSLLLSLVLALAPARLRIGFPLFKSPSSSFIHTSDQGQGSLGAGFRSDSRVRYLDQTLVKSTGKKKNDQGGEALQKSSPMAGRFCLGGLTLGALATCEKKAALLLICLAITERIPVQRLEIPRAQYTKHLSSTLRASKCAC